MSDLIKALEAWAEKNSAKWDYNVEPELIAEQAANDMLDLIRPLIEAAEHLGRIHDAANERMNIGEEWQMAEQALDEALRRLVEVVK